QNNNLFSPGSLVQFYNDSTKNKNVTDFTDYMNNELYINKRAINSHRVKRYSISEIDKNNLTADSLLKQEMNNLRNSNDSLEYTYKRQKRNSSHHFPISNSVMNDLLNN